jgi:hypothetical protein
MKQITLTITLTARDEANDNAIVNAVWDTIWDKTTNPFGAVGFADIIELNNVDLAAEPVLLYELWMHDGHADKMMCFYTSADRDDAYTMARHYADDPEGPVLVQIHHDGTWTTVTAA